MESSVELNPHTLQKQATRTSAHTTRSKAATRLSPETVAKEFHLSTKRLRLQERHQILQNKDTPWVVFHQWVTADPPSSRIPADVSHRHSLLTKIRIFTHVASPILTGKPDPIDPRLRSDTFRERRRRDAAQLIPFPGSGACAEVVERLPRPLVGGISSRYFRFTTLFLLLFFCTFFSWGGGEERGCLPVFEIL